jgi:cytochrome c-type biogenesis protein CcmE
VRIKKRFLIGGLVVFVAIGYLVFTGLQSSTMYYFTVSEFAQKEAAVIGETVRINGQVASGTVTKDDPGHNVKFTITEGGQSLPVIYQGVLPDTFKEEATVVVEGQLNDDGMFRAQTIMLKCPSKYVPK